MLACTQVQGDPGLVRAHVQQHQVQTKCTHAAPASHGSDGRHRSWWQVGAAGSGPTRTRHGCQASAARVLGRLRRIRLRVQML